MAVVLAFMMLTDERVGVYGCHGDVKHVSAELAQQCLVSSVHRDTRARAQTGLLWQHIALLWGHIVCTRNKRGHMQVEYESS